MDLAEAIGTSSDYLRRIEAENCSDSISIPMLHKSSVVLDVEVGKFFEE